MASLPGDLFVDVTAQAGVDFAHVLVDGRMSNVVEALGTGAAFLDYDRDGLLDLFLVQGGWAAGVVEGEEPREPPTSRLYHNLGDGTFRDVTGQAGVDLPGFGLAAVAADYDGDGWTDLYVGNLGGNFLYRNRGNGTFEEVAAKAGVADSRLSVAGTFFDYDGDSVLDLFVANYLEFDPQVTYFYGPDVFPPPLDFRAQSDALFRGRGDGTFEDVSERSGIASQAARAMSVVAADFDADGRPDVFVSNDASANFLWRNQGDGTFRDVALESGVAFGVNGDATAAMTADWGDYDGDGGADLVVTDLSYGSLYRAKRPGVFEDRVFGSGMAALSAQYVSWGGGYLDFDGDGDLDLLVVDGDLHHMVGWQDLLIENDGTGHFTDARSKGGAYFSARLNGRGGVVADYDNDGDVDILVTNVGDRPVLLRNESPAGNAWISLQIEGLGPGTIAYGAKVTLRNDGRVRTAELRCPSTYLSCGDPRLHFGLGQCKQIESIEVVWPDGERRTLRDVMPNQILVIRRLGA